MPEKTIYARDIALALESWADPSYAESYDNTGLQVGSFNHTVTRVLIALDLTPQIVDEAIHHNASMILTHHPLLFRPPTCISDENLTGQLILQLARENITLYSAHTNLDAAHGGVSIRLAKILGLHEISFLNPSENGNSGMGAIGQLSESKFLRTFLHWIHTKLNIPSLRYVGSPESIV